MDYGKLYKKAGKGGWESIIPFYSKWIYAEISGVNWWWFLLLISTTIVSIIFDDDALETVATLATLFGSFVCNYNLAKRFSKDTSIAILTTIFPIIMIPIMGFSKNYQYDSNIVVSKNGPFGQSYQDTPNEHNNPINNELSNISSNDIAYCPNCGTKSSPDSQFCGNCGQKLR